MTKPVKNRHKAVKLPDSDTLNRYGSLGAIHDPRKSIIDLCKRVGDLELQISELLDLKKRGEL